MNEALIKHQRYEGRLLEVLSEAMATLRDDRLSSLVVVDVKVSKGKYDADIFLDGSDIDKSARGQYLSLLKKATKYLQNYCKVEEDWFKIPKFHFKFDDSLSSQKRLDELFEKIKVKETSCK